MLSYPSHSAIRGRRLQNSDSSGYGESIRTSGFIWDLTRAHLLQEPTLVATGKPPRIPDFVLTSKDIELERAYKLRFNLIAADGREIPRYWVGYYDASPRKSVPAVGFKRRKPVPGTDDEDE